MRKFTLTRGIALVFMATMPLAVAACGVSDPTPTTAAQITPTATHASGGPSTSTPTPTLPAPTQTPGGPTATPTPTPAPPKVGWTANLPVGGKAGQLAPDTPVLLADGSTKTLSEVAAGKPMLLHFFATW